MFCEKMRRSASFDVRYGKHVKIIADGEPDAILRVRAPKTYKTRQRPRRNHRRGRFYIFFPKKYTFTEVNKNLKRTDNCYYFTPLLYQKGGNLSMFFMP